MASSLRGWGHCGKALIGWSSEWGILATGHEHTAASKERIKVQHWNNVKQAFLEPEALEAQRADVGQEPRTRPDGNVINEIDAVQ